MKFFIRGTQNGNRAIIQVNARIVELKPYGKFLVHKAINESGKLTQDQFYVITEPQTGAFVGTGDTVKDAYYDALDELDFKLDGDVQKLSERIKVKTDEWGILNIIEES